MTDQPTRSKKKYYTVAEANAALPLVRVIVRDITELASQLRDRHDRLSRLDAEESPSSEAHAEELQQVHEEFVKGKETLREYVEELTNLGIELKDVHSGLIDFPCWMDGREVYLCWRYGEPEVAHWHELDAGFAGRQPVALDPMTPPA